MRHGPAGGIYRVVVTREQTGNTHFAFEATKPPGGGVPLHLQTGPSLAELAAVTRLNPYHFARQFKRATGLPPHQYVIARRVERAKDLLRVVPDLSLVEVTASTGFSDQSQFTHHFKRLVGVTPGRFEAPARIA